MYDIITFGAAIQDIYIKPEKFKLINSAKFATGKGVCFNLGSKINVTEMDFFSGGGGTNTAATFAKQGFVTAYCGAVGNDISGLSIIDDLAKINIDVRLIKKIIEKPTDHSIILNGLKGERNIFVYRGASEFLENQQISWQDIKDTKWFYLAPLSGKLCDIFEPLVNFAKENNIKVAVNLGSDQLNLPKKTLKNVLSKIDILILNQEEASMLTKIPFKKEKKIFQQIDKMCPGIAIMTKGKDGVAVSDGEYLYFAKAFKIKSPETAGAGDAFGAGFVTGYIKENKNIEFAMQMGLANSASCLAKTGAKNGLLSNNEVFEKTKIDKILIKK